MIKEINGINGKYKSVQIHTDYNKNDIYYFGYRYSEDGKITKAEITEDKYKEICLDCENFLKTFTDRINENEKILKKAKENGELFDFAYDYYLKLKEKNLNLVNTLIEKVKKGEIYFDFKVFEEISYPIFGSLKVYNHLHHLLCKIVEETWVPKLNLKEEIHRRDGTYTMYENYGVLEPMKKTPKLYKLAKEYLDDDYNYLYTKLKDKVDLDKGFSVEIPEDSKLPVYTDEKILQRHKNILKSLEFLYEKCLTCEYYIYFNALYNHINCDHYTMEQVFEYICDILCNLILIKERFEPLSEKKTTTKKTTTATKKENTKETNSNEKKSNTEPHLEKKVYNNGDTYEGEFLNGKRHGKGTYKFHNGDIYTGEWKDGKAHGIGEYFWKHNADRYKGNFLTGQRSGKGVYYFNNGSIYEGFFQKNNFHGFGKIKFANGNEYKGIYENNKRSIFGRFDYINGDWEIGEYKNDKLNGFGAIHFADLSVIVGYFKDGKLDTTRDYIKGDHEDLQMDSVINKPKFAYLSNGRGHYFGESRGSTPNGFGIQTYYDGSMYMGNFVNNKQCGHGIWIGNKGAYYIGEFVNDNFHGKGKINYSDTGAREGTFINGKLNGKVKEYDDNGDFVGEFNFINGEKE